MPLCEFAHRTVFDHTERRRPFAIPTTRLWGKTDARIDHVARVVRSSRPRAGSPRGRDECRSSECGKCREADFSIAAQPVSQALREYAQQSGDQIVFYSDVGRGRESTPVQGTFTRQEALQRLLLDTGLKSERVNSKTVAISAAAARAQGSSQGTPDAASLHLAQPSERAAPAAAPRNKRVTRAETSAIAARRRGSHRHRYGRR